jgi:hypothetical protein
MVSCCWINKLVERAKNPRHWALRCGWTFNASTSLVGGSIEEMKRRRYEMECDKEFRSHVCAAHRRAKNPTMTLSYGVMTREQPMSSAPTKAA